MIVVDKSVFMEEERAPEDLFCGFSGGGLLFPLANLMCSPRSRCDYNRISEPIFLDIIYILCGF